MVGLGRSPGPALLDCAFSGRFALEGLMHLSQAHDGVGGSAGGDPEIAAVT